MLSLIGAGFSGYAIFKAFSKFYPYFIPISMVRKYLASSGGEYVMITGGSDGVGK